MGRWRIIGIVAVSLVIGFAGMLSVQRTAHTAPPAHEFTLVNVEANGVDYHFQTVVPASGNEQVTFTARKGTTSRFCCHLHPAHIGGQVIVVP